MNFFKAIWVGIVGFFQSDMAKKILALGLQILKIVAGNVGADLMTIAKEEVAKAEASGLDGQAKYEAAFAGIRKRLPSVAENAINLAIEVSVAALT